MRSITTRIGGLVLAALAVAATGACSGSGDDEDGVATLGGSATEDAGSEDDEDAAGGGSGGRAEIAPEFEEAMLEFAECMREHGIDFPDPGAGGGGAIVFGPAGGDGERGPSTAEMEEFEAANEACGPILEEARESMPRPDPEQVAEMQDQMLAFAECMREHGIDFPDPQFTEDGGVTVAIGGPDGDGPDPSDPDFQDAQDECAEEGGGIFAGRAGVVPRGGDESRGGSVSVGGGSEPAQGDDE